MFCVEIFDWNKFTLIYIKKLNNTFKYIILFDIVLYGKGGEQHY